MQMLLEASVMKMMSSNSGRTFRPLMPRPYMNMNTTTTFSTSLHNPKLTSWTQQSPSEYGGGKRGGEMNRLVSSRWNPTPEQVQALEEMYRRGTRTPTADQIQQIAAKLRRFGKIEGKNVFYWFQNHKARDRQKKRRQLQLLPHPHPSKQPGRIYLGIDQQTTLSKSSTASKYEMELQQQSTETANRTTESSCRALDLSSSMSPNVSMNRTTDQQENAYPFVALNKLLTPKNDDVIIESEVKENRTLELFPVRSTGLSSRTFICSTKEEISDVCSVGTDLVPSQFFEFLPTKN